MNTDLLNEGNKLIAAFDGWAIKKEWPGHEFWAKEGETYFIAPKDFRYHSSWDWLMPVVETIHSLSYNDSNNKFQPTVKRFLENDINSVWRQVVQFIQWYNKNKQP